MAVIDVSRLLERQSDPTILRNVWEASAMGNSLILETTTDNPVKDEEFLIGSGNYLADRGYEDPDTTRRAFLEQNAIDLMIEELERQRH